LITKEISFSILVIIFIIELTYLSNFVKRNRQKFVDVIYKYPDGLQPNEWHLLLYYLVIKEQKCCGIDRQVDSPSIKSNSLSISIR
jgi:hypothetical protein